MRKSIGGALDLVVVGYDMYSGRLVHVAGFVFVFIMPQIELE